jgi:hypothetical protein
LFRKDRSRVDWLSIVKTTPKGRVQVIQEGNDKVNTRDNIN